MLRGHMFVQDFVQIGRNFGEIRTLVLANPRALLAASAGAAYRDGEQILVRLAPSSKHPRFGKSVKVDLGDPYEREDQLVVPMHWWAPGVTRLYPHLDADLEFAEFGAGSTQITLIGNYDPPLGAVGRQVNVILLHRVANASIRSFLTRVSRSLEQSIQTSSRTAGQPQQPTPSQQRQEPQNVAHAYETPDSWWHRDESRSAARSAKQDDSELGDIIADTEAIALSEAVSLAMLRTKVENVLDYLRLRERRVLQLRFGLIDGQRRTLEEVGKRSGVARERIVRSREALRQLRHPSRSKRLVHFLE